MTIRPTDLLGTWTLTREVDDRRGGEKRWVEGTATLARVADDHVHWSEEGTMRWTDRAGVDHAVPVGRGLDVRRDADGAWVVHFADGRVFHPWAVGEQVDHACSPDHYRGRIDVEPDRGVWTVTWHSSGPEKDYVLRTQHRRLTAVDRPADPG